MRVLTLQFIVVLLLATPAQAQESRFFTSLYDVPVMQGLSEMEEKSVSFDKIEGRIAYAVAENRNLREEEILSFYTNSLPQLGWQKQSRNIFVRENEKLEISIEDRAIAPRVMMTLSPL